MQLSGCRANWSFFTSPNGTKRGRIREIDGSHAVLCSHEPIETRRWIRVALHEPVVAAGQQPALSRVAFARVTGHYEMIDLWEDDSLTLYRHALEWIEPLDADWVDRLSPDIWDLCECGNLLPRNSKANQGVCGLCSLRVAIAEV